jgi:hypothetical protein
MDFHKYCDLKIFNIDYQNYISKPGFRASVFKECILYLHNKRQIKPFLIQNLFNMKNFFTFLTLMMITTFMLTACASNRTGYRSMQRKGYGCPANASIQSPLIEKNKI